MDVAIAGQTLQGPNAPLHTTAFSEFDFPEIFLGYGLIKLALLLVVFSTLNINLFETNLLTPNKRFNRTKILKQFCQLLCVANAISASTI